MRVLILAATLAVASALVVQNTDASSAEAAVHAFSREEVAQFSQWIEDRLADVEAVHQRFDSGSALQVSSSVAPVKGDKPKAEDSPANVTLAAKAPVNSTKVAKPVKAKAALKELDSPEMLNNIKHADKTQLMIMKAMMQGMYEKFKADIGHANKQQVKSSAKIKQYIVEAEARKVKRAARMKKIHSNMTDNSTDRILSYWKKMVGMHKRHYHSMLRLSHASMTRLKKAMDAIDLALAGKLDPSTMQQLARMVPNSGGPAGAPQVVFLQRSVLAVVDVTAKDLHDFHDELRHDSF